MQLLEEQSIIDGLRKEREREREMKYGVVSHTHTPLSTVGSGELRFVYTQFSTCGYYILTKFSLDIVGELLIIYSLYFSRA